MRSEELTFSTWTISIDLILTPSRRQIQRSCLFLHVLVSIWMKYLWAVNYIVTSHCSFSPSLSHLLLTVSSRDDIFGIRPGAHGAASSHQAHATSNFRRLFFFVSLHFRSSPCHSKTWDANPNPPIEAGMLRVAAIDPRAWELAVGTPPPEGDASSSAIRLFSTRWVTSCFFTVKGKSTWRHMLAIIHFKRVLMDDRYDSWWTTISSVYLTAAESCHNSNSRKDQLLSGLQGCEMKDLAGLSIWESWISSWSVKVSLISLARLLSHGLQCKIQLFEVGFKSWLHNSQHQTSHSCRKM